MILNYQLSKKDGSAPPMIRKVNHTEAVGRKDAMKFFRAQKMYTATQSGKNSELDEASANIIGKVAPGITPLEKAFAAAKLVQNITDPESTRSETGVDSEYSPHFVKFKGSLNGSEVWEWIGGLKEPLGNTDLHKLARALQAKAETVLENLGFGRYLNYLER